MKKTINFIGLLDKDELACLIIDMWSQGCSLEETKEFIQNTELPNKYYYKNELVDKIFDLCDLQYDLDIEQYTCLEAN